MNFRAFINRPTTLRAASGGLNGSQKTVVARFHKTNTPDIKPVSESSAGNHCEKIADTPTGLNAKKTDSPKIVDPSADWTAKKTDALKNKVKGIEQYVTKTVVDVQEVEEIWISNHQRLNMFS